MKKLFNLLLLAAILLGGGLIISGFDLGTVKLDGWKLDGWQLPMAGQATSPSGSVSEPGETISVATFNIQVFGQSKLKKQHVMNVLAQVARRFDVVAVQEIRSSQQDVLPRFVDLINADGSRYDYAIGPRLGRTSSKEQYAYVYNTKTIELDRRSMYTVNDPDDLLHREPFVAAFRAKGAPSGEAFTFTLINIHTDPDETDIELDALDDVFYAVRNDGRQEDDIILLGDLNVDDRHLGELGRVAGIRWVISGTPTNTRGTKQYDNILFDDRATTEFTGRAGVLSLQSEFGLSQAAALEVSDHLPVWAVFDVREGGVPGRIATRPAPASR